MKNRFIPATAVLMLAMGASPAAFRVPARAAESSPRPDFTGVWKLNLQKSKLQVPAPESGVFRIEHREPSFKLSRTFIRDGKEDTWGIGLTTDGKEVVQEEKSETFRGRLTWVGSDLFLDSTISMGTRTATNKVTYHLSEDSRILTAAESFRGPIQKHDNLWVFDKE